MPLGVTATNHKLAAIVLTLKSKPPINFSVGLHTHALAHGLSVNKIVYRGPKVGLTVKHFSFEAVKAFAKSLPEKFPHVLHAQAHELHLGVGSGHTHVPGVSDKAMRYFGNY